MGDKSEALVAAYYLFRFDHHRLGLGNQGETFKQLARELGVKKSTLKNQRDFFDSHSGSHREGWKKPMNAAQQAVFDKYVRYSEAELRAELEALIKSGT